MFVITVTGAESTGKSTLSSQLAAHYHASLVTEYSRAYLTKLDRPYTESDLLEIAKGQLAAEQKATLPSDSMMVCDTSLLVMKMWSLYKYGSCNPWIEEHLVSRHCDLYILPHYDIPYEDDPLRENPDDRDVLYHMYLSELNELNFPYLPVSGDSSQRLAQAISVIDQYILG